jgi:hypothetical protein
MYVSLRCFNSQDPTLSDLRPGQIWLYIYMMEMKP